MSPMNQDELKEMLDRLYGDQNRSTLRISNGPAADFTAASDLTTSENASKMRVSPTVSGDAAMAKMTAQELDEHRSRNRTKVRKVPQAALTLVTPATVPQVATPAFSETATDRATFVEPDAVRPTHRRAPFVESVTRSARLQPLWRWLFAPPPSATTTDLVQLKRNIKEWTKLQLKIDKLKSARQRFDIRSEIARYIFLIVTAAFYILIACAALRI